MAAKPKPPAPSPSDDLIPRTMLPNKSVIPSGREFGAGAPKPSPPPKAKKKRAGGSIKGFDKGGVTKAPAPPPRGAISAGLSKLGGAAAKLGAGAARLGGFTNLPGLGANAALAAKEVYDQYRDNPDTAPVQSPQRFYDEFYPNMRKGGKVKEHKVKKYAKGGSVGSASKRADGCATKGKTRGKFV
jgi:hypothetical protein